MEEALLKYRACLMTAEVSCDQLMLQYASGSSRVTLKHTDQMASVSGFSVKTN